MITQNIKKGANDVVLIRVSTVGPVEHGITKVVIANGKKDGHKNNATFNNKMGGSTYYCADK